MMVSMLAMHRNSNNLLALSKDMLSQNSYVRMNFLIQGASCLFIRLGHVDRPKSFLLKLYRKIYMSPSGNWTIHPSSAHGSVVKMDETSSADVLPNVSHVDADAMAAMRYLIDRFGGNEIKKKLEEDVHEDGELESIEEVDLTTADVDPIVPTDLALPSMNNDPVTRLTTHVDFKLKAAAPFPYDGEDPQKAEDYITDITSAIQDRGLDVADSIQLFGMFLTGNAKRWYNQLKSSDEFHKNPTFENVYSRFVSRFTSPQRVREAYDRVTTPQFNLPLNVFQNAFLTRLNHYNTICGIPNRISESEAVNKFMISINEVHRSQCRNGKIKVLDTNVEAIGHALLELEAHNRQLDSWSKQASALRQQHASSLYSRKRPMTDSELNSPMMVEYRKEKKQAVLANRPIVCNRCKEPGHKSIDCPARSVWDADHPEPIKCSHCGIKGHTMDSCFKLFPHMKAKQAKKKNPVTRTGNLNAIATDRTQFIASIKGSSQYVTVDSFCTYSIITLDKAKELEIKLLPDPFKTQFTLGDKSVFSDCGKFITEELDMCINGHSERIQFCVVPVCVVPIILGHDWLSKHNPSIDYRNSTVLFEDEYCKSNCISKSCTLDLSTLDAFAQRQITGIMSINIDDIDDKSCYLLAIAYSSDVPTSSIVTFSQSDDQLMFNNANVIKPDTTETSSGRNEREIFLISITKSNGNEPILTSNVCCPVVDVTEQLPPREDLTVDELKRLPESYHDLVEVFSKSESEKLPAHRPYDISIDLMEGKQPTWGPLYNLSENELTVLKDYIEESLRKGHIRPSNSPCGAPVLFVKKKDGSLRLCVDYRALNAITVRDRYPLPLIDNLIDQLRVAVIFTALDLRGAYNLVRVRHGDEWKTAFRTRYGQYEYLVMPFGLTNAPAVFQRLMNDLFRDYLDQFVVVYLDDILVFSKRQEDHVEHVRIVLKVLLDNGLYCKFSKCEFHVETVEFLGYVIGKGGVSMNQKKVEVIMNWKVPSSKTEVQSFIGFANYYRRFIREFAKLARPLHQLTKKDTLFIWTDAAQEAFETLKHRFVTAPILIYANPKKQFIVETDASNFAIGCVLSQYGDDNLIHPVAFYSCKLSDTETRWPIHDKELYGIIVAFRQWRRYLRGTTEPVLVYTDHRNLQYFMSKNLVNDRQIRWSMELSDYRFVINYRPGSSMGKADALSRQAEYKLPVDKKKIFSQLISPESVGDYSLSCANRQATLSAVSALPRSSLLHELAKHTYTSPLWNDLVFNQNKDKTSSYSIRNGLIYKGERIWVPNVEHCKLLVAQLAHDHPISGHLGIEKTRELVRREFTFDNQDSFIQNYVNSCDVCARCKPRRHLPYGLLHPLPIPLAPWRSISMDCIGPLPKSHGYDLILVIVDRLTKMIHFAPTYSTMSSKDLQILFRDWVFRLHGFPDSIVTDRGTIFTSKFWESFTSLIGIELLFTTAYHQQANGQSERTVQRLKEYLRMFINYRQSDWYDYLALAEFAFNNCIHSSTGISPFKANYGYDFSVGAKPSTTRFGESAPEAGAVVKNIHDVHEKLKLFLRKSQEAQKKFADRHRMQMPQFKVGNKAWLRTTNLTSTRPNKSLDYKCLGPFEILEQVNDVSFKLKLPPSMKIHDVFHVSYLEPHVTNTVQGRETVPPLPVVIKSNDGHEHTEYVVEKILVKRIRRKRPQYLVHWHGYNIEDRTWEPLENLENAKEMVRQFEQSLQK